MTEFIPPATLFHPLPSPFAIKRGGALHGARIAYETWGTLNAARDNAILILTPNEEGSVFAVSGSCLATRLCEA